MFDRIADIIGEQRQPRNRNSSSALAKAALTVPNISAEEEAQLFCDRNQPSARDRIIAAHMKLAVKRASVHQKKYGLAFDDLLSEAILAIYAAVKCFQPAGGVRFNTYARRVIDNALKGYTRDFFGVVKHPRGVAVKQGSSLNVPVYEDGLDKSEDSKQDYLTHDDHHMVDRKGRAESGYLEAEQSRLEDEANIFGARVLFEVAEQVLNARELLVFKSRHSSALTLDELGATLGLSGERVRQIEMHAVAKLRAALKKTPTISERRLVEHLSRAYIHPPVHYRAFVGWIDRLNAAIPARVTITPKIRLQAHRVADSRRHKVGDENLDWIRKLHRKGHSRAQIEATTRLDSEFVNRMLRKIGAEEDVARQGAKSSDCTIIQFPRRHGAFSICQIGRAA